MSTNPSRLKLRRLEREFEAGLTDRVEGEVTLVLEGTPLAWPRSDLGVKLGRRVAERCVVDLRERARSAGWGSAALRKVLGDLQAAIIREVVAACERRLTRHESDLLTRREIAFGAAVCAARCIDDEIGGHGVSL